MADCLFFKTRYGCVGVCYLPLFIRYSQVLPGPKTTHTNKFLSLKWRFVLFLLMFKLLQTGRYLQMYSWLDIWRHTTWDIVCFLRVFLSNFYVWTEADRRRHWPDSGRTTTELKTPRSHMPRDTCPTSCLRNALEVYIQKEIVQRNLFLKNLKR